MEQLPLFDAGPARAGGDAGFFLSALTLWVPWTWAILGLPPELAKRLENRPWKPPRKILGRWICLHASAARKPRYEAAVAARIREVTGRDVPDLAGLARGAIVGLAKVSGYVETSDDPWFMGPAVDGKKNYGWLLEAVRPLAQPVPCRGYQRLWGVPSGVAAEVVARCG
jgi:hypothetical protein